LYIPASVSRSTVNAPSSPLSTFAANVAYDKGENNIIYELLEKLFTLHTEAMFNVHTCGEFKRPARSGPV